MKMRFLWVLAIVGMWLFLSGCQGELLYECRNSAECDAGLTCVDGSCQNLEDLLPDPNEEEEEEPVGGDCRVDPCEEGLLCNQSTGACENCTLDEQCDEFAVCHAQNRVCTCQSGYVRCGGVCVSLDSVESCGSECVPCPSVQNGEAICVERTCSGSCDEGYFFCDEGCDGPEGQCVECLENEHCSDPSAPVCSQSVCRGCTSHQDCAGIEGAGVCDEESGSCVECLLDELDACDGASCDPELKRCTSTPLGSRGSCRSCLSDQECGEDHFCYAMEFAGEPRESAYCLKIESAECEAPFTVWDIKESITTGELEIVCGINEELTTCEAVLDYDRPCASADDCGHPDLNDGLCEPIEFDTSVRCTYPCDFVNEDPQCVPPFGCASGGGTQYCGAW